MTIYHDNKKKGSRTKVVPINSVEINNIKKDVEVPNYIPVDIEVPAFHDKEYERPVIKDKEYERPVITDKEYERPVIKKVEHERPVPIDKKYERPILVDKAYERPVITEKEYTVPIPVKTPYDLPVVAMEKVQAAMEKAAATLLEVQKLTEDINETAIALDDFIDKLKAKIPEDVTIPNIIHEDLVVKVPKLEYDTIHVVGKVIAKEEGRRNVGISR